MSASEVEKNKEIARLTEEADLASVLSTPQGRRFMWRVIDGKAGALNGSFSSDPLAMAFAEGRRSVGLMLVQEIQALYPERYVEMLQERMRDLAEAKLQREKERAEAGEQ